MAHEVEGMVYSGDTPWHGLGIKIPDNLTPEKILTTAGLDWTVSKRPLIYDAKEDSFQVPQRFALVRDSDDQFLDIVGKNYQPTQNADAFEFFDAFVKETKLKMHTAGSLCKGKFVWALASMEKGFSIGSQDDRVDSYVLLVSPHQWGSALSVQHTTVRVVCKNTLTLALNEKGLATYRMTHSRLFDSKAKLEAAKVLGLVSSSFQQFEEQAHVLASKSIRHTDAIGFFEDLLGISDQETLSAVSNDNGKRTGSKTLDRLLQAYDGGSPGASLIGTKDTAWGLVNAVTHVLDHVGIRDQEISLRDNFFGWRGSLKRKALKQALYLAA